MKVTKRGVPESERKWKGRCRKCDSEAEATGDEMTHINFDATEGHSFSWEKCPVCGAGSETGYGGMLFYPVKSLPDSFR